MNKREQPSIRELTKKFKPEDLINSFLSSIRKSKNEICRKNNKSLERAMDEI